MVCNLTIYTRKYSLCYDTLNIPYEANDSDSISLECISSAGGNGFL